MKIYNKLWRNAVLPVAAGLMLLESASAYAARCEYVIQSEWNSGFVAAVRITNDTNTAVNGWSVNWSYSDGSKKTGGWNANFSGNNPYAASNVSWNGAINPGQTVEFGIQGNKGVANNAAAKPVVSGAVCGSTQNSSSIISSVRSSSSSSIPSSSSSKTSSSAQTTSSSKSSVPSSPPSSSVTSNSRSSSSSSSSSSSYSTSSFDCRRSSCNDFISSWSSSRSSIPNISPVPDLKVTAQGLTVYVDTTGSVDADGDILQPTIDFGDSTSISYPTAWHTYKDPGEYLILLTLRDGKAGSYYVTKSQLVSVSAITGNQAPIARLTTSLEYGGTIGAKGSSSFDLEGTPLTYDWDYGEGSFSGDASISISACGSGSSSSRSFSSAGAPSGRSTKLITLTVSDGELKDTIQRSSGGGDCNIVYDIVPSPDFSYVVDGYKVSVDARASLNETGFSWNFGDGSTATGLLASHTYASPGTYNIRLGVSGPSLFSSSITKSVIVGSSSSSVVSSSSSVRTSSSVATSSSSSRTSSSVISSSSSSVRSSSSQGSSDRNRYTAPRATTAPIIDGVVDSVWDRASWAPINVFWLGTQSNPSAQDYSGRYKALWDENYLYILYDITDDRIYDGVRDPLDRYWEDDTVELFIDENKNGGQHGYNTSAWAYHISTYGDVVDSTTGGAKLLNDHIDSRLVSNGTQHYWELRVRIYGEDYADWKSNTPLQLYAGKLMGFSACYIDNDGSSQRESMMGSVDTQGHKNNQGYLDASVFGSLLLVE